VVVDALDDDIDQVVVLGAGYDSRAWRLARPGVRFFEVDRSQTQTDKRRRAPGDGPVYVPADLTESHLHDALEAAGLDADPRTVFTAEGVTVYLTLEVGAALLATTARCSAPGSRLVVNFADRTVGRDRRRAGVLAALGRERFASGLASGAVAVYVEDAGSVVDAVLSGRELASRALAETPIAGAEIDPSASVVIAHRPT
jgi:methyltransferase (TIGR00027 family)